MRKVRFTFDQLAEYKEATKKFHEEEKVISSARSSQLYAAISDYFKGPWRKQDVIPRCKAEGDLDRPRTERFYMDGNLLCSFKVGRQRYPMPVLYDPNIL